MKRRNMCKRTVGTAAVALSVALALTGCGQSKSTPDGSEAINDVVTEAGQLPIVEDKITLTIGMPDNENVEDFETNAYTLWLEEQTGIDLKFVLFSQPDPMQKLRLMFSSNSELPDILLQFYFSDAEMLQYGRSGLLLDMTDMIEKHGYWIKDMFDNAQRDDWKKEITSGDGKIYYVPDVTEQVGNWYGAKAWLNKSWLDTLNLDMPETTEDLKKVLAAFRDGDPNGNGKKDEIPITSTNDGWMASLPSFLMNSFIYDDRNYRVIIDENDKVSPAFITEEWRDGLRYMNDLVSEGLMDPQCFTLDDATFKTLAQNEDGNIVGSFTGGSPDFYFPGGTERLGEYTALPPLKGPKGVAYAYGGKNITASDDSVGGSITKYCKHPNAAFRLLDFMYSEESFLRTRYGVPNVDWEKAQEGDVALFESIGAKPVIREHLVFFESQNQTWMGYHPNFGRYDLANGQVWNKNPLDGEYVKAQALTAYLNKEPEKQLPKLKLSEDEYDEFQIISTAIKDYVGENMTLFITGKKNLDTDWDEYVKELESMDLKRYIKLIQKGYDNYRALK